VETLVELDHEYGEMAREAGCPAYVRVPALGVEAGFIDSLADMALQSLGRTGIAPAGGYACAGWSRCPRTEGVAA
jgi:ferrochelatase